MVYVSLGHNPGRNEIKWSFLYFCSSFTIPCAGFFCQISNRPACSVISGTFLHNHDSRRFIIVVACFANSTSNGLYTSFYTDCPIVPVKNNTVHVKTRKLARAMLNSRLNPQTGNKMNCVAQFGE